MGKSRQIIVLRKDLKMRKGKMVAQGAHASMQAILNEMHRGEDGTLTLKPDAAMSDWLSGHFTKICVSVDSEEALDDIYSQAVNAKIPCAMIVDSGKTEFHGMPTRTAVAVGPADEDIVRSITGQLPLL